MFPILMGYCIILAGVVQSAPLKLVEKANGDQAIRANELANLDRKAADLDARVKQTLKQVGNTQKRAAEYIEKKRKQEEMEKVEAAKKKDTEKKP